MTDIDYDDTPSLKRFLKIFGALVVIGGALLAILNARSIRQPVAATRAPVEQRQQMQPMVQGEELAELHRLRDTSWVSYRDAECMLLGRSEDGSSRMWQCGSGEPYEEVNDRTPDNWHTPGSEHAGHGHPSSLVAQ